MNQRAPDIDDNLRSNTLCSIEKLASSSPSLPNFTIQNKAVILKLKKKSESVSSKSTKLKSLLPKSLSSSILTGKQNESFEIASDTDLQNDTMTLCFSEDTDNLIAHQPNSLTESKDNTPLINIEFRDTAGNSQTVEALLRHYSNSVPVEQRKDLQNPDTAKNFDKGGSIIFQNMEESLEPETLLNSINSNNLSMQEKQAHISSQNLGYETNNSNKHQKVVKKSKIEAFVKMVVCRKITIQKVLAETGQILETKVKNEEEEPVTLDVDCVETTEDMLTDSAELLFDNTPDLTASKWTSLDGGLKFLSTVSESRQKIGKNFIKDQILESSLKKVYNISRMLESASHKGPSPSSLHGDYNVDIGSKKDDDVPIKTEHVTDSDNDEWNEDVNDDSEDYVPSGHVKKSFLKTQQSDNYHQELCDKMEMNESHGDSIKLIPKRRGRKRKWDNALGISSNLRSCVFCNKHFNSTAACSEHMKIGNCISSVFCFICSKPFDNENELENHLSAHCNERKPKVYECVDCYRSYRTRAGYEKHFRMGTCLKRDDLEDFFTGPLQCDLCPSRFSTQAYLRLHRYKVHENPKDTHTCLECGKKFYSSIGYNKHKNGRPCTEPLKCWVCGKTYSSKAKESFKIHMKHHKSEVGGITFNCDECGRGYMTQMALTKHKLSHTGVKPYKCETCGKAFAMRYMVKDHARTHTGERPYLCSLCGNAFSNKGHLGRHLRSHENRTLQKKGRPKKIRGPEASEAQETELKIIDLGQTLQGLDAQSIQVVNSQMFESHGAGAPMIIQTNDNTIIIADGWPPSSIVTPGTLSNHSLH
ncbi:hypothetical protein Btru_001319 [Bulinus truncatus]|nr:hypothetical protein Btru_001319 [Bulinus truncatus]